MTQVGLRAWPTRPRVPVDYLYDGTNLLEEVDNNGNVLARYAQDLTIDQPLSELRSGTTNYYEQDGLASVTSLSNWAGALVNTYSYDSYGKLTASSGTITNPFQYTGRESDIEPGIYNYRARYYDQSTGRFLSQDRPNAVSDSHGFYQYALNNPVLWIDPTGLIPAPAGLPPVPVPGAGSGNGWRWNPNPSNSRGGTWGPQTPIPGQSQPSASWDPDGHWDVDNGKGDRQRYDPDGNPITPQQAHPTSQCAPRRINPPNLTPLVEATVTAIILRMLMLLEAF